jgi:peptidoglycan/xylan/chitin deacetylase (PgdA/CDA1 family)
MPVAVLMYHGVGEPADPSEGLRYTVTEAELGEQIAALDPASVVSPSELRKKVEGRGVVLTFDDGEQTVLSLAAPVLKARGIPAVLFMTSGNLTRAGYLDGKGLRELASMGFTIGAHGATHRFLNTLPDRELDEELAGAKKTLEDVLGTTVADLSLPGGRGGPRVTERARAAGYETIYTSIPGWNGAGMSRYAIRRTAIRRGMSTDLVRRYAECDPIAHAKDVATMTSRGLVRRVVGEERYHRLTAKVLTVLRRQ